MKVAVIPRANEIRLVEVAIPAVRPEEVLLRVSICGICGSDVDVWRGNKLKQYPYSPGHEFCGVIEQIGTGVHGIHVGQRVVVDPNLNCGECVVCQKGMPNLCDELKSRTGKSNGGLAEYAVVNRRMVYLLPERLPDTLAPFIEPLSCALHVADVAGTRTDQPVVIFGAGLLGVLTGLVLKDRRAKVVFVEPVEGRRERIRRCLGLSAVPPATLSPAGGQIGFEIAIDCSGSPDAIAEAIRVLRKAGRLVLGGVVRGTPSSDASLSDVTRKELELRGAWLNPHTFPGAVALAVTYESVLACLETETFSLDRVHDAFERAKDHNAPKVLVTAL